ncbi:MAG: phosphotransferase [Firmicutes bacterium]|nr:phosphotransferase [Bacillota bacterium]
MGQNCTQHADCSAIQRFFQSYLDEHWPQQGAVTFSNLQSLTSGWETDIYTFDLFDDTAVASKKLVMRVYSSQKDAPKALREFHTMRLLAQTDFPVPSVYLLDASGTYLSKPFLVMDYIPGQNLRDLISDQPHQLRELLGLFCRMFVDLHDWDWRPHGELLTRIGFQTQWVNPAAELSQMLNRWSGITKTGFQSAFNWLRLNLPQGLMQTFCLNHGDLHPGNILMREGKEPYLIDWGGARLQDFRVDLAWSMLLLGTYGPGELRDLVLKQYEAESKRTVTNIEWFEALASLKRLIEVYVFVSKGVQELGMRQDAVDMMKSDLPHLTGTYGIFKNRTGLRLSVIDQFLDKLHK